MLFDDAYCEELDAEVVSTDPLDFVDSKPYLKRIAQAQSATGLPEAVITAREKLAAIGAGRRHGHELHRRFDGFGGGEKITRLIERAIKERGAVIMFAASAARACRKAPYR